MAEEKLLTVREVAIILGVSEKEIMNLAEKGELPAYKVGGVYVRFKKEQVASFKKKLQVSSPSVSAETKYSFSDKVSDFFYFNDFYILAALLIILLAVVIVRGY